MQPNQDTPTTTPFFKSFNPMTPSHGQALNKILKFLKESKWTLQFREPVRWQQMNLDQYPLIVKKPMDLSTIEKNLQKSKYRTVEKCLEDIQLIWENSKLFNAGVDWILKETHQAEKVFHKGIRNYLPTVTMNSDILTDQHKPKSGKRGSKKGGRNERQSQSQSQSQSECLNQIESKSQRKSTTLPESESFSVQKQNKRLKYEPILEQERPQSNIKQEQSDQQQQPETKQVAELTERPSKPQTKQLHEVSERHSELKNKFETLAPKMNFQEACVVYMFAKDWNRHAITSDDSGKVFDQPSGNAHIDLNLLSCEVIEKMIQFVETGVVPQRMGSKLLKKERKASKVQAKLGSRVKVLNKEEI